MACAALLHIEKTHGRDEAARPWSDAAMGVSPR